MIKPTKVVPVKELVDFRNGPFRDIQTHGPAKRRVICQQLLRQMLKHPEANATDIIIVNEQLKAYE